MMSQIEEEAAAFMRKRIVPRAKGGPTRDAILEGLADQIVDRAECFFCGTRKDLHDEFGCARWRPMP